MNYSTIYASLILSAKRKGREKRNGEYFERHHIVPRCFGGTNQMENLVLLTAKEHFLAHHLLVKVYAGHSGMQIAFWMMCHSAGTATARDYRITSSVYDKARRDFSELASVIFKNARTGTKLSVAHKEKISASLIGNKRTQGYKHTDEARAKIAEAASGRLHSVDAKLRIGAARAGFNVSAETRKKIGAAKLGTKASLETRMKMSESAKARHARNK